MSDIIQNGLDKDLRLFKLNLSDEKAWKKIRKSPNGFRRWFWWPLVKFVSKFWLFIVWALSIALSSGLTVAVRAWAESHKDWWGKWP